MRGVAGGEVSIVCLGYEWEGMDRILGLLCLRLEWNVMTAWRRGINGICGVPCYEKSIVGLQIGADGVNACIGGDGGIFLVVD